jgi:hypothetical protein
MSKFRKKPVVVEAYRLDNRITNQPPHWINQAMVAGTITVQRPPAALKMAIQTLEGTMTANEGDWIIKGVADELYPCKPDIFEATYDPVEASA